ncbi:MAG: hypothetical protein DMG05_01820 [Acidobacteria bacterium]|nr:MAG: hypothetical protein DMG05_01820 [Acidobacteriota bacterium]
MNLGKKKKLLALLLLLLIFSIFGWRFLKSQTLVRIVENYLIANLDHLTGGKTSIESLKIHFFPLKLHLSRLTIRGTETSPAPPLLSIQEIEAAPKFRSLLGSLRLVNLELLEPKIYLEIHSDGSTNIPKPHATLAGFDIFALMVEKLKISRGLFQLDQRPIGLDTELDNFALTAGYSLRRDSYRAQLTYQNGRVQLGKDTWNYGLNLLVEILRNEMRVEKLMISWNRSKLEAEGVLRDFKSPQVTLTYGGLLDLLSLKQFYPDIRNTQGLANFNGKLEYAQKMWKTEGTLAGKKLSLNTVKVDQFSTQYSFEPSRAHFEKIKISGMHGWTEGNFTIQSPFQNRLYKADLKFKGIGLLDLSLLARLDKIKFGGFLNGTVKADWRDQWKDFVGEGHLSISQATEEGREHEITEKILPLSGELNFALTSWSSAFENSHLRFANTQVEFVGILSANSASNLRLELRSDDLNDISFVLPGLRGQASFIGTVQGRLDKPKVRGSFVANKVSFQEFFLDHLNGQFEADSREIQLSNTAITKNNSEVMVEGRIFLDPSRYLPSGAVHLVLRVRDASAEDLYALWGQKLPTSGIVSGDFTATGKYPQVSLQGIARVRQGKFFNQPYDSGRFEIQVLQPSFVLQNFNVYLGQGKVTGSAEINLKEESMRSSVVAIDLPLNRLQVLNFPENPISGTVSKLELKASGNLRRPALQGSLRTTKLEVAGELVGDFLTQFHTQDQIVSFTTDSLQPSVKLKADGTLTLNENYDFQAKLSFENFVLSPYVKKVLPVSAETLSSQAEGQVKISGPLRQIDKLDVSGLLSAMKINFRETQLQTSKPFEFQFRDEKVFIRNASFSGKGTVLNLDGFIDLSHSRRLNLEMKGDLDLALVNEFIKKLSASGDGKLNATIRGTLSDPRIQGYGTITDGQFSYGDLPNSLSQVTANLFFDENQIRVNNFSGSSGGGKVLVNGDLIFGQETIKLVRFKIEAREVRFRYPEGMRNVVDADLELRGSQRSQLLAGNVRLLSASFQKDYDPITEFLQNRNNQTLWPASKDLAGALNLDLNITGDRNIKLDTSLMKITSSADLRVKGTTTNPLLTGRIEATGGELYFQGARYRITRGRIDFVSSARFDPHLDLEAETDVRDYRVILTINGTADKFRADLHSDPPLSTVDLFSLVSSGGAGARGLITGASSRPFATAGRQQDSSLGAASVLSEGLSLKVGSRVKRIFGLDRFRVDPFLVGNERDPAARVTFGQQITKDLSVTYSTSLSSNEQQVILLEYNVNDSTSIIASRDDEGAFGLDVRFRKRLGQKNR